MRNVEVIPVDKGWNVRYEDPKYGLTFEHHGFETIEEAAEYADHLRAMPWNA